MEELRQALTVENYTTARSADSYPAFSPMLVEWLKEGWLLASAEMQHSELRGGVLLLALLHSPLRYIPPAAARLLTVTVCNRTLCSGHRSRRNQSCRMQTVKAQAQ